MIGKTMDTIEETALSLAGKKRKLKLSNFEDYAKRLGISANVFYQQIAELEKTMQFCLDIIHDSFMSKTLIDSYQEVISARWSTMQITC